MRICALICPMVLALFIACGGAKSDPNQTPNGTPIYLVTIHDGTGVHTKLDVYGNDNRLIAGTPAHVLFTYDTGYSDAKMVITSGDGQVTTDNSGITSLTANSDLSVNVTAAPMPCYITVRSGVNIDVPTTSFTKPYGEWFDITFTYTNGATCRGGFMTGSGDCVNSVDEHVMWVCPKDASVLIDASGDTSAAPTYGVSAYLSPGVHGPNTIPGTSNSSAPVVYGQWTDIPYSVDAGYTTISVTQRSGSAKWEVHGTTLHILANSYVNLEISPAP
jgi:hypothetical protein